MGVEIAGSLAGAGLAKVLGPKGNANSTDDLTSSINNILNKALQKSINTSTAYTNAATDQQRQSLQAAIAAITGGKTAGNTMATNAVAGGFNRAQQLRQPYTQMGLNASDALARSLGLATPKGGSVMNQQMQQQANELAPLLQQLKQADGRIGGFTDPTTPTSPALKTAQDFLGSISREQAMKAMSGDPDLKRYLNDKWARANVDNETLMKNQVAAGLPAGGLQIKNGNVAAYKTAMGNSVQDVRNRGIAQSQMNLAAQQAAAANAPLQAQYQTAMDNYNKQKGLYGQQQNVQSILGGLSPQQMQILATQLKGKI
jgi:outer membrane protein OmpA-like peptidoglycan-associated protein